MDVLVSVILPVRNGEAWLARSIASILRQTHRTLELIVVDDGSTDRTGAIARATGDPRVTVLTQSPRGLPRALNRAVGESRGPLIARMDADDESRPERLARQVAFLAARPEVGVVGTACVERGPAGEETLLRPPEGDEAIRRALIRYNPLVHSSIMMRRAVLDRVGGYDEAFAVAQDYDLWLRLGAVTRLANLGDPLVTRHLVSGRVTAAREDDRLRAEARARWRAVRRGDYPAWCAIFALRPVLALVAPRSLRQLLRRVRGR